MTPPPDDYAPFPTDALGIVAQYHDDSAHVWKPGTKAHWTHLNAAKVCRDAVAAHDALRDRFLEQTMLVRELEAKLDALTGGTAHVA